MLVAQRESCGITTQSAFRLVPYKPRSHCPIQFNLSGDVDLVRDLSVSTYSANFLVHHFILGSH